MIFIFTITLKNQELIKDEIIRSCLYFKSVIAFLWKQKNCRKNSKGKKTCEHNLIK